MSDKVKEKQNYVPLSTVFTKPNFETKTNSLRNSQYKILEIYWCAFHMSQRAKLNLGLVVLLSKVTISLHSAGGFK